MQLMRNWVILISLLLTFAAAGAAAEPPERLSAEKLPLPWYRGDENSKLRLRYDFGPCRLTAKAPLSRKMLVGLQFEIRF